MARTFTCTVCKKRFEKAWTVTFSGLEIDGIPIYFDKDISDTFNKPGEIVCDDCLGQNDAE